MSTFSHDKIEQLLASYAIDAVDGDEAEAIELHLRECGRCRAAVAHFRQTIGHLAAGPAPAPVDAWDAIASQIDPGAPRLDFDFGNVVPLRRRGARGSVYAAAAVALILIVTLGLQVGSQDARLEKMHAALDERTILSSALAAESNPAARRAELRNTDGTIVANAVLTPDGTGFLRTSLRTLDSDRTYQLWAVVGTERISAGVLGPDPGVVPFRMAGHVSGLAVTEEVAAGVVATQHQPIATGLLVDA